MQKCIEKRINGLNVKNEKLWRLYKMNKCADADAWTWKCSVGR